MQPVYFPFTYISKYVANLFYTFFEKIIVYQPNEYCIPEYLKELSDQKMIDIRVPIKGDEKQLMQMFAEFKSWGETHFRDGAALMREYKKGFYNELFISQIRSEIIKKKDDLKITEPNYPMSLRLFLQLAQDFDAKKDEVDQRVLESIKDEVRLFTAMTGESAGSVDMKNFYSEDLGAHMEKQRIEAWFHLMIMDTELSPFLLTNSPAAFDHLNNISTLTGGVSIFKKLPISVDALKRDELMKFVTRLAHDQWKGRDSVQLPSFNQGDNSNIYLTINILVGASSVDLFKIISGNSEIKSQPEEACQNTVIGLLSTKE